MKYINTIVGLYESVDLQQSGTPVAFRVPFDGLIATMQDGYPTIGRFKIVTQFCFLGTNNEENQKSNFLYTNGTLEVVVRITKCAPEDADRLAIDLDQFDIDISELRSKSKIEGACFPFLNYTRITDVNPLKLAAGIGNYVIKVLIKDKDKEDEEYTIQSMCQLKVVEPSS